MSQVDRLERWLGDLRNGTDEAVIAATRALLEMGECGSPAGTYPLEGAKAAMRAGRLADAVIFLHHGLLVAEPNTVVWADLLVNRAIACAHHGFCRDAIAAGEQFLQVCNTFPPKIATRMPFAHHAVGFAYDKLKDYRTAAIHYRLAVDLHVDPIQRAVATSDLAYALVLDGNIAEAEHVLAQVDDNADAFSDFVKACTTSFLRYHQRRFNEAVTAAERAEALALGKEELWAAPLAELWYWHSKASCETGDRYLAVALALRAAITADRLWLLDLRDKANEWLAEIMDKGGIHSA